MLNFMQTMLPLCMTSFPVVMLKKCMLKIWSISMAEFGIFHIMLYTIQRRGKLEVYLTVLHHFKVHH